MPPIILFFIAVLTPFLLLLGLCGPLYMAIATMCYIVYAPASGAHPLDAHWFDPFIIIEVYHKLFNNWLNHGGELSFMHYTLPLIGLPLVAVVVTVFLMRYLIKKLVDIFYIPVGDKH
jgi:hypothetical protein